MSTLTISKLISVIWGSAFCITTLCSMIQFNISMTMRSSSLYAMSFVMLLTINIAKTAYYRAFHKIVMIVFLLLTRWGRVTHICVVNLTTIGSDNGLSSGRRQAIIWTSAGILLIGPLGTNFSENLIGIQTFSFTKMYLKMSSAKWRPFCPGLNVLMMTYIIYDGKNRKCRFTADGVVI